MRRVRRNPLLIIFHVLVELSLKIWKTSKLLKFSPAECRNFTASGVKSQACGKREIAVFYSFLS